MRGRRAPGATQGAGPLCVPYLQAAAAAGGGLFLFFYSMGDLVENLVDRSKAYGAARREKLEELEALAGKTLLQQILVLLKSRAPAEPGRAARRHHSFGGAILRRL